MGIHEVLVATGTTWPMERAMHLGTRRRELEVPEMVMWCSWWFLLRDLSTNEKTRMSRRCDLVVFVVIIGYIREIVGHLKVCYGTNGTWPIDLDDICRWWCGYVDLLGGYLEQIKEHVACWRNYLIGFKWWCWIVMYRISIKLGLVSDILRLCDPGFQFSRKFLEADFLSSSVAQNV